MKNREHHIGRRLARLLHGIGMLLLVLVFLFGLLLLILGAYEQHTLNQAKENYTAVSVQIKELRPSAGSGQVFIAVLEPVEEEPHRPGQNRLGNTAASTMNRALSEGEILTMYYDPDHTDTRVVDFKTAMPLLRFGGILCGGTTAIGLVLLLFRLIQRRKPKPAVHLSGSSE